MYIVDYYFRSNQARKRFRVDNDIELVSTIVETITPHDHRIFVYCDDDHQSPIIAGYRKDWGFDWELFRSRFAPAPSDLKILHSLQHRTP